MAERTANLLVFGLVASGTFSTVVVILPNLPSDSIWCVFLSVLALSKEKSTRIFIIKNIINQIDINIINIINNNNNKLLFKIVVNSR